MKMAFVVYFVGVSVLALSGTTAYSDERSAGDGKGLFEKKCGGCHTLRRSTSKRKTTREWQRTVLRMKNAIGVAITDQEAKEIIEYLSENYGV
jgi:mono/diheme cytochrome c family protein